MKDKSELDVNRKNSAARKKLVYISGNIRDGVGQHIWQGILRRTKELDSDLICYVGGELGEDNSSLVYNLIDIDKRDGFISHAASERELHLLYYEKFKNLPFIALSLPIPGFPVVMTDSYNSMRTVVEHLVKEHSFSKIAFVQGPENHIYAEQRYQAYLDVVQENSIYDPNLVTPPLDFEGSSGEKSIAILLDDRHLVPGEDIEAIVFVSDTPALNAVQELGRRDIRIPEQIAVTGFNAGKEAFCTDPPMTTVRLPFTEQGYQSVDLLMKLIDGQAVNQQTVLSADIIIAQSCGCNSVLPGEDSGYEKSEENIVESKDDIREQTIRDIQNAVGTSRNKAELIELAGFLLTAFYDEIEGNQSGLFLGVLSDEINRSLLVHKEVVSVQRIISLINKNLTGYIIRNNCYAPGAQLLNRAGLMIHQAGIRAAEREYLKRMQLERTLRDISAKLISTYNMNKLLEIFTESLKELKIPGCYISLFEDSGNITSLFDPPDYSKIIFVFEDGIRRNPEAGGVLYPSKDLLPPGYSAGSGRKTLIVHSLNYNSTQIGFVVFELGPEEGFIYFALSRLLSNALENKYIAFLHMLEEQNGHKSPGVNRHLNLGDEESDSRYFYANLNPENARKDFILYGGVETWNPQSNDKKTLSDSIRLEVVIGGKGELRVERDSFSLFPGLAYMISPHLDHQITSDHSNPLKKYFIIFQGQNVLKILKTNGYECGNVIQLSNLNDTVDLFELLFRETSQNGSFSDDINTELLYLIVFKILESRVSENIFVNVYTERFQKCKAYIDQNYLSIHTMDDIVKELNIQKT
ncbi:MAG: substrate-binding domain-containing protein, partial [Spirochaetales bacterium]|nr:substrate-binding domain-containing protein [Spirochaetales bacterium]